MFWLELDDSGDLMRIRSRLKFDGKSIQHPNGLNWKPVGLCAMKDENAS